MEILEIVKLNERIMIQKLKEIETIEYRRCNSKEKFLSERKNVTQFLRSILERKDQLINEILQNNENQVPENTEARYTPF